MKKNGQKLDYWKRKLARAEQEQSLELQRMDRREQLYSGSRAIKPGQNAAQAPDPAQHVRNLAGELIETQVSSSIPQPKVTAMRPEDEPLAQVIEDMLRNELDRLPFEYLNDQQERTTPIQGGDLFLAEWDSTKRTHTTVGELTVTEIHPKKFIPQPGVFSDIEDMDYYFLKLPQTKAFIKRRYGVDVEDETETDPEVKGIEETADEDMVTQIVAYYRNRDGGIGLYSWAGDTELADLEDCQARRIRRCVKCGMPGNGKRCAYCGGQRFDERVEQERELYQDIVRSDGSVIPAFSLVRPDALPVDPETGLPAGGLEGSLVPTRIPYYEPRIYPIVLRKNVSRFGQFLGDSDVDKIEDQQETTKKLSMKVIEKVFKGGSVLTLPEEMTVELTDEELRVLRVKNPTEKALIDVYNLQPDISADMALMSQVYEEARQIIGITDSFQGRQDTTATSGVAKEFSAKQAAGRLESKRTMKDAFYARLFEVMFKLKLAYTDEPRMVVSHDNQGHAKYSTFDPMDFLVQDDAGEWYYNDRFLFSTDASATLASDRQAMWQECRMNFQQGAYGDPSQLETLLLFWSRMEQLHYPGAGDTKSYLEDRLEAQRQMAVQQTAGQTVPGQEAALSAVMGGGAGL